MRWLHFRHRALSTFVVTVRSLLLLHRHAHAARCDLVVVRGHVQSPSHDARTIRATTAIYASTTSRAARTSRQDEPRGHVRRRVHVQPFDHDKPPSHDKLRRLPVTLHSPRLVREMQQQDARAA